MNTAAQELHQPVSNTLMARKELEDSACRTNGREVCHDGVGGWRVVAKHPILTIVDSWDGFRSEHEAQAFADNLTIHDDIEEHEAELDLDISLAEELDIDGVEGITSWVDPSTIADYNAGVL